MKKSSVKVSVVIPCYNQALYVSEAIESVLNQTFPNIEIVIVNDGSSDNSSTIIETFSKKYSNIHFINNEENQGVIYARNLAIEKATGEYILPLDGDDIIEPTYIEKAVKILDTDPEVGIVYCKAKLFGSKNEYWGLPEFNKDKFLKNNCIFCSALFRKTDFIRAGKYKTYMKYGFEDWELWISFIELGLKPYRIDEILFNYRKYNEDSRTNLCSMHSKEMKDEIKKHHADLYIEPLIRDLEIKSKKHKKYKKLFNIFSIICILEIIIIFCLVWL